MLSHVPYCQILLSLSAQGSLSRPSSLDGYWEYLRTTNAEFLLSWLRLCQIMFCSLLASFLSALQRRCHIFSLAGCVTFDCVKLYLMALAYSNIQSRATCSGTDSIMNLHIWLFRSCIEYPLASDLKWIVYGNQRHPLWITKKKKKRERKSFAVSLALIWTSGRHPSQQQTADRQPHIASSLVPCCSHSSFSPPTPLFHLSSLDSLLTTRSFPVHPSMGAHLHLLVIILSATFSWFGWQLLWPCPRLIQQERRQVSGAQGC